MNPSTKPTDSVTIEGFIRAVRRYREQNNSLPAGVKMRKLTACWLTKDFPVVNESQISQTIHGITILEDDSIPFGEYELVP